LIQASDQNGQINELQSKSGYHFYGLFFEKRSASIAGKPEMMGHVHFER
jgi:hypothetical protein